MHLPRGVGLFSCFPSATVIEERTVKVNAAQWIGRRVRQEDAYAVRHFPQGTLVVVCDGMGGHACGSKAAEIASKSFADRFDGAKGDSVSERMRDALNRANQSVGEFFAKERAYGGCTLLAVYLSSGVLWWTSVGDSPLLVWRRGRLMRLNADHSLRAVYEQMLRDTGASDIGISQAHSLRSAVTGEKIPLVDAPPTPYLLLPGDRIIMGSDGMDDLLLSGTLPDTTKEILDRRGNNLAVELVKACEELDLPEADNVTVLTIDYATP